ncbi:hypothetical protein LUZ61_000447 [Rhynchospora tenuis]|uniref:HAT C-terminal dimerisation domain-containing protein n=1 Tax=Rhynchospora tenuis TaxID=198213 RepID=A0AAD5ZF21_9POAL|nr:hypothetical protein LUZ61_000447 [Rhynchospora tenuis]
MLDLGLELKDAISRYALLDSNFESYPDEVDWEHVKTLVGYLKLFYDVTNKFSGTKYPTLNILFAKYCEVFLTLKKMSTSSYPFVVKMSKEMVKKWEKYWKAGTVVLAIACVLDPRCKLDVVEYYFKMLHPEECPGFMENLKSCLNDLFKEYSNAYSKESQNQANNSTTSTAEMRLTRGILTVPISTVASESTFSTAGKTLSPARSSLNDESLEALICAQDWLRASVTETGGAFGDVVWSSEPSDETICGNAV